MSDDLEKAQAKAQEQAAFAEVIALSEAEDEYFLSGPPALRAMERAKLPNEIGNLIHQARMVYAFEKMKEHHNATSKPDRSDPNYNQLLGIIGHTISAAASELSALDQFKDVSIAYRRCYLIYQAAQEAYDLLPHYPDVLNQSDLDRINKEMTQLEKGEVSAPDPQPLMDSVKEAIDAFSTDARFQISSKALKEQAKTRLAALDVGLFEKPQTTEE
ncbi:MAG: hypothetical protein WA021_04875 [Minisyncoccia bacterium]